MYSQHQKLTIKHHTSIIPFDAMSPQAWSSTSRKISETISAAFGSSRKPDESIDLNSGPIEVEWEDVQPRQQQSPTYLLVLGRSGSGKSYHIDNAFCKKRSETKYSYRSTIEAGSKGAFISRYKFRFIDTPGFDNPYMSDAEVLAEIGDYFLHPKRSDMRISGVLYVHQAGDTFRSRTLARVFDVLSGYFLGSEGLSRLTVLVACDILRVADHSVIDEMRHPGSIFSKAVASGAHIEMFDPGRNGFQDVLGTYVSKQPISLPIQQFVRMSRPSFVSHMEDLLGCYELDAFKSRLMIQENKLKESFDGQVRVLNSNLEAASAQLDQYHTAHQQIEAHRTTQDETISSLRQELLQSHQEYSSLRSQLQLQENFEQSEIVQELKDLNRRIEDFGRSFSACLTDRYVFSTFGKDFSQTTALDALNLPELKSLLGHSEGKPSLISFAEGKGMDVEGFLDFSIRGLLCTLLHSRIFWPFHPFIPVGQSQLLHDIYKDIKRREPQAVTGKWRSNTFKSVYAPPSPDSTEDRMRDIIATFLSMRLNPLIAHFFGQIENPLEEHHLRSLQELINVAWEWNAKLKGSVIMLGDFRTIVCGTQFHPAYMEEFEPSTKRPQARHVLGTLALGLISQRAIGGGQPPEETVVCKALVVTENVYT
ncbi:unnamed protein product [Rhizoctonia solani]|uniref:G domain-containing protein n=1 Tax=Rhizoctonia solani TaxID=456999 RepID=A0A8H2X6W4_9AGAM|nr:unnamed protein product [Rhizoctonia solani]